MAPKTHTYRIEFYELTVKPTPEYGNTFAALQSLAARTDPLCVEWGGITRELWKPALSGVAIRGSLRKFRMSDLPEIGSVGGSSRELQLEEDQGLVEKNFFTLYRQQSLLAWHTNGHANRPEHLARVLAELLGTEVLANPLIQSDALRRLLRGEVEVRSMELSIPRPKDPSYYPENEFNKSLFSALAAADGDRIAVRVTTDARINAQPRLTTGLVKSALKEIMVDDLASTARVNVNEDGIEHPIDLIADRLLAFAEIEHDGRYPPQQAIFNAFDAARREEQEAIHACLGKPGSPTIR